MFKSLRWRLASSYMLVTLLTALVIGGAAYVLMHQYIDSQERASLESNAQSVVTQARPLLWPVVREPELQSLVTMTSYLGDVRVRVLDLENHVLADSGSERRADQFLWVLSSESGMGGRMSMAEHMTIILPIHEPDQHLSEDEIYELYGLSPEMTFRVIRREALPWGSRIDFQHVFEQIVVEPETNVGQVVLEPITESGLQLGFVEVIGDPGFGKQTLDTTARVIAIATAGAMLISGGVGFFIAQRVTKPVNHLAEVTTVMSEGDLSIRAPELGKDEIGRLGQGFNKMADSLETSFKAIENERDTLRRFVDDASHEFRTPITALMNFLELLSGKAKRDKKSSELPAVAAMGRLHLVLIPRSGLLFIKLPDELDFSLKLYAKPLPYPVLDFANQGEDIGRFRISGVQDKSGMFGTDHGPTHAFTLEAGLFDQCTCIITRRALENTAA